jgi:cation diffusion facilitator family transporter
MGWRQGKDLGQATAIAMRGDGRSSAAPASCPALHRPISGLQGAPMHEHSTATWRHDHVYLGEGHDRHERRTWLVVALTLVMMVLEIAAGAVYGSMALTADGWHMSTHAAALAIAAQAYRFARTHVADRRFSFGTGKMGELAAFASAIVLGIVALLIGYESVLRLFSPVVIRFAEAAAVAALGLAVNLGSAWILAGGDHHGHEHGHSHDTNIRAALLHVLADALTSVLAIAALLGGYLLGASWLDAVIGLVGAAVILRWSFGLIVESARTLLDVVPDARLEQGIRERLEIDGDCVADLHLWRLGPGHAAVIAAVVSDQPQAPETYKRRLRDLPGLSHVTVEVHRCPDHA